MLYAGVLNNSIGTMFQELFTDNKNTQTDSSTVKKSLSETIENEAKEFFYAAGDWAAGKLQAQQAAEKKEIENKIIYQKYAANLQSSEKYQQAGLMDKALLMAELQKKTGITKNAVEAGRPLGQVSKLLLKFGYLVALKILATSCKKDDDTTVSTIGTTTTEPEYEAVTDIGGAEHDTRTAYETRTYYPLLGSAILFSLDKIKESIEDSTVTNLEIDTDYYGMLEGDTIPSGTHAIIALHDTTANTSYLEIETLRQGSGNETAISPLLTTVSQHTKYLYSQNIWTDINLSLDPNNTRSYKQLYVLNNNSSSIQAGKLNVKPSASGTLEILYRSNIVTNSGIFRSYQVFSLPGSDSTVSLPISSTLLQGSMSMTMTDTGNKTVSITESDISGLTEFSKTKTELEAEAGGSEFDFSNIRKIQFNVSGADTDNNINFDTLAIGSTSIAPAETGQSFSGTPKSISISFPDGTTGYKSYWFENLETLNLPLLE
jgi:cellobiose-specific phosphotransferase system component IIB